MTILNRQEYLFSLNSILRNFGQQEDFFAQMLAIFGERADYRQLQQDWLTGKFSLPKIEIVNSSVINNALGAYAAQRDTIYLSQELIDSNNRDLIIRVLVEEYGHYLDNLLNITDSAGDEGEYFALTLLGQNISATELLRIKTEDDTAIVSIDGESIEIEQYTNNGTVFIPPDLYIGFDSYTNNCIIYNGNNGSAGIIYNGNGATGNIYNGNNAEGYIYNGNSGRGNIYNGNNAEGNIYNGNNAEGYIYNGNGADGHIINGNNADGRIYNGNNATGNIYNGNRDIGFIINGNNADGRIYNGNNATGNIYNGNNGSAGRIHNGDGAAGYIYNGDGATGYIYNGNSGMGYIYNGDGATGYIYNGNSGMGYIYNGNGAPGSIYNGHSGMGYIYNGINGTIINYSGSSIINYIPGYIINDGIIDNQGTFTNQGILAGSGTFKGNLTVGFFGVIAPGGNDTNNYTDTNGIFTVQGNLAQSSYSILNLSLTDTSSFDILKVTGDATFNRGSIELINFDNFSNYSFASGTTNLVLIDGDSDNNGVGTLVIDSSILTDLSSLVNSYDVFTLTSTKDFSILLDSNNLVLRIVNIPNNAPTDLSLSSTNINENVAANSVVGTFSSIDPDSNNTFTYSFVSGGTGTINDNSAFTINGNQLIINNSPNYEAKSSYNIQVQTTDQNGLSYQKNLTININDLNEAPTDIALSASSINENIPANSVVGTFSSIDPDSNNTFTYSFVSGGTGTINDNSAFTINGNQLIINNSPNYEAKSSYNIQVQTTDQNGASYQTNLTININDLNEAPTVTQPISNQFATQSVPFNFTFADNTFNDQDLGNSLTYSAKLSDGNSLPSWLTFNSLTGTLRGIPDNTSVVNLNITVTATDQGAASVTNTFSLNINPIKNGDNNSNFIQGNSGNNLINGGGGDDFLYGNTLDDIINGGLGNDFLEGYTGNDTINGNEGNDRIYGDEGNDTLLGSSGNDILVGGSGDDFLEGGDGSDRLIGNDGIDIFMIWATDSGNDRIYDYTDGIDKLGLANGLTFSQLNIQAINGSTEIRLQSSNTLLATLYNTLSTITSSDTEVMIFS